MGGSILEEITLCRIFTSLHFDEKSITLDIALDVLIIP